MSRLPPEQLTELAAAVKGWARELGFQACGIAGVELREDEHQLRDWLAQGQHGEMAYMAREVDKRARPATLQPGTLRVISVRMDYGSGDDAAAWANLADASRAYIARYTLGRDYHKVIRNRLQKLAERIVERVGPFGYRAFVDSAPVLERALARDAGLGWVGKHSCLIDKDGGSWFFLGELFTDLPLPVDTPASAHCGTCRRCLDICPTQAIVAPYRVDARRCISYLTIEYHGPIPMEFREAIGNRIFGCDDCQLICPWNKFAKAATESGFKVRHGLDNAQLADLFLWGEDEYLRKTEGMALRRAGYWRWLRNLAIALGNAPSTPEVIAALQARRNHDNEIVREHVAWALAKHGLA